MIPKRSSFEYNYEYTPYSFEIEAETAIDASLLVIFGVQLIRQSLDFSPHAAGMMFYSKSNPDGVLIDGVVTDYSDVLDQSERQNWVMASGETGTVFLMFDINLMKNSKRRIYFRDQKENPWTGDETGNTGDQYSYGDMGVMIEATGDALITDKLTISYKGYFLDKTNANVEFGKQLLSWEQNPIDVSASTQYYEPATLVEEPGSRPDDFKLHAAYPNPFSMTSDQSVRFEFSGQVNELYNLVVYNAIGQQVAEFKNLTVNSNGRHSLLWDAHDNVGMPLMTGVYFYKLQNGAKIQTGKLVVSR